MNPDRLFTRPSRPAARGVLLLRTVATLAIVAFLAAPPTWAAAPKLPDLVPLDLTLKPSTVPLNTDVGFKVKNQGKGDAAATIAWIFVDGNNLATVQIDKLGAGKSKQYSTTLPPVLKRGTAPSTIEIRIDPENTVAESNEGNNSLVAPFTANASSLADLIVDRVSINQTAANPPQVRVNVRVKNQGKGDAGAFQVKEWQPQNPDNFTTYPKADGLKAGQSYDLQFDVLPLALDPFTLFVHVNPDNAVQEANEANNEGSAQAKLRVDAKQPNLVVENLRASVGDRLFVEFRVRNIGGSDVTGTITAETRDDSAHFDTSMSVGTGGLKAGQFVDVSVGTAVPSAAPFYGTRLVLIVNPQRTVPESVYSDNYASTVIKRPLQIAPPAGGAKTQ